MNIYAFNDYKEYVKSSLLALGHGARLRLAHALTCQSAYITRVLNHEAHFSTEQALEACEFFNLDQDEEEFFLLLVQLSKAGTKKLKEYTKSKIKKIREARALLSNRINIKEELNEVDQGVYYSKWYYAAIHILVTLPSIKNKQDISDYLHLPMVLVNESIEFLTAVGLVTLNENGLSSGKSRIFLKGNSPFVVQHHENWRLRAIDNITTNPKNNVHFSSVYSLSKSDFEKIKEKLLANIQEVREIVTLSPEEEVCVLNVDFFKLKN